MDRRKFVNFSILNQVRTKFIQRLREENIDFHCILGNHDVYYRNTNEVNSVRELFGSDIKLYEKPEVVEFDGLQIALLPWVNKENHNDSVDFIKTASAPILLDILNLKVMKLCEVLNSTAECRQNYLTDMKRYCLDTFIVAKKKITCIILEHNTKSLCRFNGNKRISYS